MKLLVVSNHAVIRESIISLLQKLPLDEPVELSSCAAGEVTTCAREWTPDLILLDMTNDGGGNLVVRTLSMEVPNARIIVLGKDADETSIYEAISAGADGYITAETSTDTLARTLIGVMKGELGLSRESALRVVQQLRRAASGPFAPMLTSLQVKLTPREQEVFDLIRQGMRSREISEQLVIAESTVYKHVQNILDKLQVHSRAQAIFMVDPEAGQSPFADRSRPKRQRRPPRSSAS